MKKNAQRDVNTARSLAVVRFWHRPPARLLSQTHRQDRLQYTAPQLASPGCVVRLCTKFEAYWSIRSKVIRVVSKIWNLVTWPRPRPLMGHFVVPTQGGSSCMYVPNLKRIALFVHLKFRIAADPLPGGAGPPIFNQLEMVTTCTYNISQTVIQQKRNPLFAILKLQSPK